MNIVHDLKSLYSKGFLAIPNLEIESLYEDVVLSWFETSIEDDQHCVMLEALIKGDIETFQSIFQDLVLKTFSMFDTSANEPEKVDFR